MDTLKELRQLAGDGTELGDNATAALVCQAIDRFSAWEFEAGEELLACALEERRKHEQALPPGRPTSTLARWRSLSLRGEENEVGDQGES
jgi:hypothetical protein